MLLAPLHNGTFSRWSTMRADFDAYALADVEQELLDHWIPAFKDNAKARKRIAAKDKFKEALCRLQNKS